MGSRWTELGITCVVPPFDKHGSAVQFGSGRQAPLPRSHTAGICCPAVALQTVAFVPVQAGRVSSIVWPPSQDSGPVQPWATKSMLLVWKFTPKVGMVLWPAVPTIAGQPGVVMLLLVVQFGSTQKVLSSSMIQR